MSKRIRTVVVKGIQFINTLLAISILLVSFIFLYSLILCNNSVTLYTKILLTAILSIPVSYIIKNISYLFIFGICPSKKYVESTLFKIALCMNTINEYFEELSYITFISSVIFFPYKFSTNNFTTLNIVSGIFIGIYTIILLFIISIVVERRGRVLENIQEKIDNESIKYYNWLESSRREYLKRIEARKAEEEALRKRKEREEEARRIHLEREEIKRREKEAELINIFHSCTDKAMKI